MKKLSLLLAMLVAVAAFTGCKGGNGQTAPQGGSSPTTSAQAKKLPFDKLAEGGVPDLDYVNCKSMKVSSDEGTVAVTLDFAAGSTLNGLDETDLGGKVPKYAAYMTGTPHRFVLEFQYLYYWDYDRTVDISDCGGLFSTVYKQFGTGGTDESFRMIFQLQSDADVKVAQSGSSLTLTFTPKSEEAAHAWYVAADAAEAFSSGEIPLDSGYFPTMDKRMERLMLISEPFETQESAEAALSEFTDKYGSYVGNGGAFAVELGHGQLPEYSDATLFKEVYDLAAISVDGEPTVLPVVIPDGIYLCASPSGNSMLFARTTSYDDGSTTDELWSMGTDGALKKVVDTDFASIIQAGFSPDGRKVGVLEQASDASYLYVIDLDTGALSNLSEEGLGQITINFIWDVLGSAIYAMSGNDSLQILKYDFTITDETQRVSAVEEATVQDGGLAFYNGDIFFGSPNKNDEGEIYKIKPEGGIRAKITDGDNFKISPDGMSMAVVKSFGMGAEDEETLNNTSIVMRNLTTGEELPVVENQYVLSFAWAQSGLLYYTVGIDATGEAEYGFTLYSFNQRTRETVKLADMKNAEFMVTPDPNVIFIPYIQIDESTRIRATYKLELGEQ